MGASIIISKGEAILSGLCSSPSQLLLRFGILKLDTLNPTNPILGFAPLPVAPSSLISPPEPVAAPEQRLAQVVRLGMKVLLVEEQNLK